ncbi:MAG: TonB family protein [Candidatus Cloacimonetes bacterium]|nr:TonB family protein [Candidatus Cloacimonadota bacterium]
MIKTIVQRSLHSELDKAVMEAIRKTKFIPAEHLSGKPVGVWVSIPITFHLK